MAFGDLVQWIAGGNPTTTLGAAPTVGNSLVWAHASRVGYGDPPSTGTWTEARHQYRSVVYFRPVDIGDTASFGTGTGVMSQSGSRGFLMEFEGLVALDTTAGNDGYNAAPTLVDLTPTAGLPALLLSMTCEVLADTGSGGWTTTPATGMTAIYDGDADTNAPHVYLNYRVIATTSGSYTVGETGPWDTNSFGPDGTTIGASFVEGAPPAAAGVRIDWDDSIHWDGDYD